MNRIASVGEPFPKFSVPAVVSVEPGKEFSTITNKDLKDHWSVIFFWPMDFTFVCPTEISEFNQSLAEFKSRKTRVFGVSTDSQYVHLAWRQNHPGLRELAYPMLADNKKELSEALGVLDSQEKVPLRATFIVDPDRVIQWVCANNLNVGRNVKEIIRVIDALQTGQLCPCNWEAGQDTIKG